MNESRNCSFAGERSSRIESCHVFRFRAAAAGAAAAGAAAR